MKPVWDVVLETVERTADAWKSLSHKEVLPSDIRKIKQALLSFMPLVTRAILRRELLCPLFMGCGSIKARPKANAV